MPKFAKGKSVWPPPVYEGRFADGTVQRMSFYSLAGKSLDFGRGRRGACLRGLAPPATDIVSGHVEMGEDTFADPFFDRSVSQPVVKVKVSVFDRMMADLKKLKPSELAALGDAAYRAAMI